MATDFGSDVQALDSLPVQETIIAGPAGVAYALARKLLEPADAYDEIDDDDPYDSLNLRDWLGARTSVDPSVSVRQQVQQVLAKDPRVQSVQVSASFASGTLTVSVQGYGASGPFNFVLNVSAVSVEFLHGGA